MARLRYIRYAPTEIRLDRGEILRTVSKSDTKSARLPQIIWRNNRPWREVNLWAHQRADNGTNIKTVASQMGSLVYYANWLEAENTDWLYFPVKKQDRCLIKFRGSLIRSRDKGDLAATTATKIMRNVISFYRWLRAARLFEPEWPMWSEKQIQIVVSNQFGFERTMLVTTTDLAIKNRVSNNEKLEDGLMPVSVNDRDTIINFAQHHASEELFLLLSLGFYTGMRIGTLCDLKLDTLHNATPDTMVEGLYKLSIGPSARPSVQTKHGVTGQIWITKAHLDVLLEYCYSTRRLLREAKAAQTHKSLVFLTRFGNPYLKSDGIPGSAINVEMHALRRKAEKSQIHAFNKFRFHQTRCTYATELARILIPIGGSVNALALVKNALLHKDEATTLKYIKFVEKNPAKIAMANEFSKSFLGISLMNGRSPCDQ